MNHVQFYELPDGKHNWRVDTKRDIDGDGKQWDVMIARGIDGGHNSKEQAQADFFNTFFGDYDDSFLAAYNEWDPQANKITT